MYDAERKSEVELAHTDSGETDAMTKKVTPTGVASEGDDGERAVNTKSLAYKYTGLMSRRPVATMCGCCLFMILLLIIVISSGLFGITTGSQYDWDVSSSSESENMDALDDARDRVDPIDGSLTGPRREVSDTSKLSFILSTKDGSEVFTPQHLQTLCRIEELVYADEKFVDFCKVRPEVTNAAAAGVDGCELPFTSVVQRFYNFSSVSAYDCTLLDAASVRVTADALYASAATEEGIAQNGFLLDENFMDQGFSSKTQSILYFGGPLEGYNSVLDDASDQFLEYMKFLAADDGSVGGVEEALFEAFDVATNADNLFPYYPSPYRTDIEQDGLEVLWSASPMRENEFARLVTSDLYFSIFSILFVYFWMWFHTGSAFVSLISMFQIVMSIPICLLIYKGIYQVPFFQQLHALTLFVILGVGADDIFVFVDGWKHEAAREAELSLPEAQDEEERRERLHVRLYHTYIHTREAVFNTSFTTAFAFIATGASPLMPIATFGYFAATAILLNYIFVMTLTPPTVLVAEKYFGCAYTQLCPCCTALPCCQEKGKAVSQTEDAEHRGGFIEKVYIPCMKTTVRGIPVVAAPLVLGLLGLGIFFASEGLQLEPPEEQEQWFPSDHIMQRAENKAVDDFLAGGEDAYARMNMVFGISGIDRGGFSIYEPSGDRGEAEFDDGYQLHTEACQRAMIRACEDIETFRCNEEGCSPLTTLMRPDSLRCFLPEFHAWVISTGLAADPYTLAETQFYEALEEFRNTEAPVDEPGTTWKDHIGFIDGQLKYASFEFTTSMEYLASYSQKGPVLDRAEDFVSRVKGYDECNECGCGSFLQTSPVFVWYRTEVGLLQGFYQGLAISFPVAFLVLLVSTGNAILAFFAIVSVFFIVFGVLGFVALLGWALGVAESVAGIIIVGFSVDYTVHLGHTYMQGDKHGAFERAARFDYASRIMAGTVVAGAVTTIGAGVFLFPAQLIFFVKMATLIVGTIVFSVIYSLGFFMGLLYLIGPQYEVGNVAPYLRWCCSKIRGSS